MIKFNPGDKVKCLEKDEAGGWDVGDEFEIKSIDLCNCFHFNDNQGSSRVRADYGNFELVESSISQQQDDVNSPSHYQSESGIECIDAIKAQLSQEEYRGYLRGNVVKYVWRYQQKGGKRSLEKARWYLNKLIEETE